VVEVEEGHHRPEEGVVAEAHHLEEEGVPNRQVEEVVGGFRMTNQVAEEVHHTSHQVGRHKNQIHSSFQEHREHRELLKPRELHFHQVVVEEYRPAVPMEQHLQMLMTAAVVAKVQALIRLVRSEGEELQNRVHRDLVAREQDHQ